MNDDKRHARLDSLLADYAYTSANDWDDYNELKRKAEITDTLEMAFKQGLSIVGGTFIDEMWNEQFIQHRVAINDVDELLEWAKGVEL